MQSDPVYLYLDHPHDNDEMEPGLFWATRAVSTSKIFNYIPGRNSLARNGSFMHQRICDQNGFRTCLNLTQPQNIIGKLTQFNYLNLSIHTPTILYYIPLIVPI